jgi:hypothetical protein
MPRFLPVQCISTAIAKSVASTHVANQLKIKTPIVVHSLPFGLARLPRSIPPETLRPRRAHLAIAHRVVNVLVSEIGPHRPRVVAVIGKLVAARVAEDMRMCSELEPGLEAGAFDQLGKSGCCEWRSGLCQGNRDHGRVPVAIAVALQGLDQCLDLIRREVFSCPQVGLRPPARGNCPIYDSCHPPSSGAIFL